jgi:hypothetical protein
MTMSNESYTETIRQLREEAAQRQMMNLQEQARSAREAVWESVLLASEAEMSGDRDTAIYYADQANQQEQEFLAVAAHLPQQQQVDPRLAQFAAQNQAFFHKYGNAGIQGFDLAHQYATRPKTGSPNPSQTGMGLTFGTPEYFSAVKDLMVMYGKDYGLNFDPNDEILTPDEAAKISGISPREYNRGVERMINEGKDSATEYSNQWDRKVG